jgi:hypothetical protein
MLPSSLARRGRGEEAAGVEPMHHLTLAIAILLGLSGPVPALTGDAATEAAEGRDVRPVRSLLELRGPRWWCRTGT